MLINQFTNFRYKNTNIMLNICVIHFICFDLYYFFEFLFWDRTIVQAIPLYGFENWLFLDGVLECVVQSNCSSRLLGHLSNFLAHRSIYASQGMMDTQDLLS